MAEIQRRILEFLINRKGQLFSSREISLAIEDRDVKVQRALKILRKYKEVNCEEVDVMIAKKIFGKNFKRKLTLYFLQ